MRAQARPEVRDELQRVPLYSALNQRQLSRLSRRFSERSVEPGTSVANKGGFFVIAGGEATVTIEGKQVATLGPGDHFGELGMVSGRARFATVTAKTQLRLLEIRFWDFRDFALTNPDAAWRLLQHVVDLLTGSVRVPNSVTSSPRAGPARTILRPRKIGGGASLYDRPVSKRRDELKRVPLFSTLNQRQLGRLSRRFAERSLDPGASVVNKGPLKDRGFFVIVGGEATVSIDGKQVATLGPGDHFGELGMVSERARFATVTAKTQLRLLEIKFWDFRDFALTNPDVTWKLLQHVVDLLAGEQDA